MTAAYLLMACLFGIVTGKVSLGKVVDMKKEARRNEYKKSGWKSVFLCGVLILCYTVIMLSLIHILLRARAPFPAGRQGV